MHGPLCSQLVLLVPFWERGLLNASTNRFVLIYTSLSVPNPRDMAAPGETVEYAAPRPRTCHFGVLIILSCRQAPEKERRQLEAFPEPPYLAPDTGPPLKDLSCHKSPPREFHQSRGSHLSQGR